MLTGVVVIGDSKPAFTLDICHPVPGASYNLDAGLAPLIPASCVAPAPQSARFSYEFVQSWFKQPDLAPPPPPPKPRS